MSDNRDRVISEKSFRWLMLLAMACLGLFTTPAFPQAGQPEPTVKPFKKTTCRHRSSR